jgi:transcriptional regulator with PAS, ATPase and Fis domain
MSERKKNAFVAVNCGAVPEPLFEREFFGHRKGAFTGATADKPGYFDRAHGGTLFLDEVGELSPSLQVKLLRALQEKEYTPLGDTVSKKVEVRIIAATNKDLKDLLRQGLIRKDFFYRIRVIVITLPPLQDRKEDIPLLIEHFLDQYAGGKERPAIPAKVVEMLCAYHWPGNVRELQNELQRYLAEQRLEFIGDVYAEPAEQNDAIDLKAQGFYKTVEAYEKRLIINALKQNHGHREKTAAMLKILPRTLHRKMKKYGLL